MRRVSQNVMFRKQATIIILILQALTSCASFSDINGDAPEMHNMRKAVYPLYSEKLGSGDKTVVFIHGYGVSRKSWYDIVPYMQDAFSIHLIDLMGFGDSPAPERWAYSIENQANAVIKYLRDNNLEKIYLVGHSYGGGVSIILNHLIKKGESNRIQKLVLISPAAYHQTLPFFINYYGLRGNSRAPFPASFSGCSSARSSG
jgi:pimeloyl-ACP methyl ester carboxylesterase